MSRDVSGRSWVEFTAINFTQTRGPDCNSTSGSKGTTVISFNIFICTVNQALDPIHIRALTISEAELLLDKGTERNDEFVFFPTFFAPSQMLRVLYI